MVRSKFVRAVIFSLGGFAALMYLISANSDYFAYSVAISPEVEFNESLTLIFGQMYLNNFTVLGSVGFIALFSYIVFAPIVGTATISFVTDSEGSSLMLPRGHKFFDSLFLNMISGVGILQLLIGTGIASILSIEGNRTQAIILFFLIWIMSATISTILGWARELWVSKVGFIKTLVAGFLLLFFLGFLTTAIYIDDIANLYGVLIVGASSAKLHEILLVFLLILVVTFILIAFGHSLSQKVNHKHFTKEAGKKNSKITLINFSRGLLTNSILLNYLLVSRTIEVRKTIIIVGLIGVISVIFLPLESAILPAVVIGFSATFSLSWLVNYYGLIGSGNIFIYSMSEYRKIAPVSLTSFSTGIIFFYNSILLNVGYFLGKIDEISLFRMFILTIILSVSLPIVSLLIAAYKPYRARLEGRGDTLLPPMVSLLYLAGFLFWSVLLNNAIAAANYTIYTLILFVVLSVSFYLLGIRSINYQLSLEKTQYNVMRVANGD